MRVSSVGRSNVHHVVCGGDGGGGVDDISVDGRALPPLLRLLRERRGENNKRTPTNVSPAAAGDLGGPRRFGWGGGWRRPMTK